MPLELAPPEDALARFALLVDGRIPTGGYAHSGGIEAAIADGRVADLDALVSYLAGRLHSTGLVDGSFAAAAALSDERAWAALSVELIARISSPALRRATRFEGRGLLRAARAMWPHPSLDELAAAADPDGPVWAVALGAVARAAGLGPSHAASAAAHASISGAAWAAVKLLGLDPFVVASVLARFAPEVGEVARSATWMAVNVAVRDLPAVVAPLSEIAAEEREKWEVRLFVS